jgi:hypothetical protein
MPGEQSIAGGGRDDDGDDDDEETHQKVQQQQRSDDDDHADITRLVRQVSHYHVLITHSPISHEGQQTARYL